MESLREHNNHMENSDPVTSEVHEIFTYMQPPEDHEKSANISSTTATSLPKKLTYPQKYRNKWETLEPYKDWVAPVPGNQYKARCKVCSEEFRAAVSVLSKHSRASKHKCALRQYKDELEDEELLYDPILPWKPAPVIRRTPTVKPSLVEKKSSASEILQEAIEQGIHDAESCVDPAAVMNAELLLCQFLEKHNASDVAVEHLNLVLRACFPDSTIVKSLNLKKMKDSGVVDSVRASAQPGVVKSPKKIRFSVVSEPPNEITESLPVVISYKNGVNDSQVERNQLSMPKLW